MPLSTSSGQGILTNNCIAYHAIIEDWMIPFAAHPAEFEDINSQQFNTVNINELDIPIQSSMIRQS